MDYTNNNNIKSAFARGFKALKSICPLMISLFRKVEYFPSVPNMHLKVEFALSDVMHMMIILLFLKL